MGEVPEGRWGMSISETEQNALQKAFNKLARWIFKEKKNSVVPEDLRESAVQPLISETSKVLNDAVRRGIEHEVPSEMQRYLRENVHIFSGLKTFHQLKEVSDLLMDGDVVKPFSKFWQDVQKIHKNYNQNYLQAEYIFATQSAQMASKWAEFERDGDRYNLQYRTAYDDRVRETHAALHNVTLPPSDPFWEKYYPPNGWRCRCTTVQVRKSKYPESNSTDARLAGAEATAGRDELFRFNPGKERRVFPDKHPYFPKNGCAGCTKQNLAFKMPDNELCRACKIVREMQKVKAKETLEYGRQNIIGKYVFKHEKFEASFIRNSFTENLRYGELFEAKVEILMDIENYLERARKNYSFEDNVQKERKPNIIGYHKLKTIYNGTDKKMAGRTVEFQFEERRSEGVFFHFIKFLKKEED